MKIGLLRKHSPAESSLDPNITMINGVYFVSGLRWIQLSSSLNYMKEARKYGKENHLDIVAIRKTDRTLQAGFIKRGKSHPSKVFSLATVLAGEIKHSFIGVFSLPSIDNQERYYLLAVKDGAIAPLSDRIYDSFEQANIAIQHLYNQYDDTALQMVYAPKKFEIGNEELDLDSFVNGLLSKKALKKEYRVKALTLGLSKKEKIISLSLIMIALIGGYSGISYYRAKEDARIQAERLREIERIRLEQQTKRKVQSLDFPWIHKPLFKEALSRCYFENSEHELSIGGWVIAGAYCDVESRQSEVKYLREGTSVNDFVAAYDGDARVVVTNQDSVSVVSSVESIEPAGDDSTSNSINNFLSFFQSRKIPVSINPLEHQKNFDGDGNELPMPSWKFYSFDVKTEYSPELIINDESFPSAGVRLSSLSVELDPSTSKLTWNIKGILYEK